MEYETLLLPSFVQNSMNATNTMKIISKIRVTLDRFKNVFAAFAVTKKRGAVGLVVPLQRNSLIYVKTQPNLNVEHYSEEENHFMEFKGDCVHKYVILLTSGP